MPVTPLHIGIPGLVSYYYPKQVDITAIILGATLIDIDFFLYLILGTKIHGFLHTFIGATFLAIILIVILFPLNKQNVKLKKELRWKSNSNFKSISIGALLGSYSHVILDMLIYSDMNPFYPSNGNPFYNDEYGLLIFRSIYGVTGICTIILLILYARQYYNGSKN